MATDSVTSDAILANAVDSAEITKIFVIKDGAVLEAKLGDGSVVEAKLGAASVTITKLGADSVDGTNIQWSPEP